MPTQLRGVEVGLRRSPGRREPQTLRPLGLPAHQKRQQKTRRKYAGEDRHGMPPEKLAPVGIRQKDKPEVLVSAAEFVLEGLHAHRRIGRSEERVFQADKQPKRAERTYEREEEEPREKFRGRRPYN